jgi:glucosamine 6-phosphate synthetase-like amidotransferase/phosphosugar isomerase protein
VEYWWFSLEEEIQENKIKKIAKHSEQRGKDSSAICLIENDIFNVVRADFRLNKLIKEESLKPLKVIAGHSR